MNLQRSQTLRNVDQKVYAGQAASVETRFGTITVHSTRFNGFCAEILDLNNWKQHAFGETPAIAFLRLEDAVYEMNN